LLFGLAAIVILVFVIAAIIGAILSVAAIIASGGGLYGGYRAIVNYKHAFVSKMSFIKTKPNSIL